MVEYTILVALMAAFSIRVAGDVGHQLSKALDAMAYHITTEVTDVISGRRAPSGG
jgi:Flp pilus assembly pilin Flp